jgi:hypothetical protein
MPYPWSVVVQNGQFIENETRDNGATAMKELTERKQRRQCLYEQLGAPCLVHRHTPSYSSSFESTPDASSWNIRSQTRPLAAYETLQSWNRFKTRWNFPIDQHYEHSVKVAVKEKRRKGGQLKRDQGQEKNLEVALSDEVRRTLSQGSKRETRRQRTLPLLQASRLTMMLLDGQTDASRPMEILENYASFDYPYLEGSYGTKRRKGSITVPPPWKHHDELHNSRVFSQQRRFAADPCYLVPFGIPSLQYAMADNEGLESSTEVWNSPTLTLEYGNCLTCIPCPCPPCTSATANARQQHSWCLLHPTGELLDRVCVSNLMLPNGPKANVAATDEECSNRSTLDEVNVVDTVLQLIPCGSWRGSNRGMVFAARTASHVSVLKMTVKKSTTLDIDPTHKDDSQEEEVCWGNYPIQELHRIDLRSLSRLQPSYRPVHIAAHPKYGNAWSDPKFAFVSHCHRTEAANVIHHVMVRDDTPCSMTEHRISNLSTISLIDFSSSHPMCLWSVARSYVSPAVIAPQRYMTHPFFDFGTSLYSIDLRNNQATFQWSPSGEEFVTEGVHSISGVMTDFQKAHRLWVHSTSAGKTWELDVRMPCTVVTEWALPSSCDDTNTRVPSNDLHGDGTLMIQPAREYYDTRHSSKSPSPDPPILTVEKAPGTFGFHLYQRPENAPRFQTKSLECISAPGLSFTDKTSIAAGTVVALPDGSKTVFTCGFSSLRTRLSALLDEEQIEKIRDVEPDTSVLCVVTMTNKGDIYLHSLAECSGETNTSSRAYTDLPVGSRAIAIPKSAACSPSLSQEGITSSKRNNGGFNLRVVPSNQYPIPGYTIVPSASKKLSNASPSAGIPLDSFPNQKSPSVEDRKGDTSPGYSIVPQRTIGVTIAANLQEQCDEHSIALPVAIVQRSQNVIASMAQRFVKDPELPPEPGQENLWEPEKPARSDLSLSVLRTSEGLWDQFDDEMEERRSLSDSDGEV